MTARTQSMKPFTKRMAAGATAGLVATVPMTAFMTASEGRSPEKPSSSLPPREITREVAEAAGVEDDLPERQRANLTLSAHFAYGAGMGMAYTVAAPALRRLPRGTRGVAFGLGVWTGSYLGWLPAVGSKAAATEKSLRVNLIMLAAHVVWGAALEAITSVNADRGG